MRKQFKRTMVVLLCTVGLSGTAMAMDAAPEAQDAATALVMDAGTQDAAMDASLAPAASGEVSVADIPEAAPKNQEEAIGLMVQIAKRLKRSEYLPAFGLFLVLLIYVLRRWVFRNVEWFQTKLGGTVMAFSTSALLTIGTMIAAGDAFNFGMITTAAAVAWKAAGMHGHAKDMQDAREAKANA